MLVLLLSDSLLSDEKGLSVLVKLKLSDHDVGGSDGDLGGLAYRRIKRLDRKHTSWTTYRWSYL